MMTARRQLIRTLEDRMRALRIGLAHHEALLIEALRADDDDPGVMLAAMLERRATPRRQERAA